MSVDWAVGDLAVCVDDNYRSDTTGHARLLRTGAVYTVEAVGVNRLGQQGLVLQGIRSGGYLGGYLAERFRKIRPDAHEACEAEFVTLLKRTKRKVGA